MNDCTGKVVLVTGASSGIGEATARLLASHGATVLLGARRAQRLERIVRDIAAESIGDPSWRELMKDFRKIAISPVAIAQAIQFAISQPADVDTSEIIIRPTQSAY